MIRTGNITVTEQGGQGEANGEPAVARLLRRRQPMSSRALSYFRTPRAVMAGLALPTRIERIPTRQFRSMLGQTMTTAPAPQMTTVKTLSPPTTVQVSVTKDYGTAVTPALVQKSTYQSPGLVTPAVKLVSTASTAPRSAPVTKTPNALYTMAQKSPLVQYATKAPGPSSAIKLIKSAFSLGGPMATHVFDRITVAGLAADVPFSLNDAVNEVRAARKAGTPWSDIESWAAPGSTDAEVYAKAIVQCEKEEKGGGSPWYKNKAILIGGGLGLVVLIFALRR